MEMFKWYERKAETTTITCAGYLPMTTGTEYETQTWWQSLLRLKRKPTGRFYANGWIETNDHLGYLRPKDVVFIGEDINDANGEKMFIKRLTSHNDKVRTYEVQSLQPIRSTDFKGKKIFKLFTIIPAN